MRQHSTKLLLQADRHIIAQQKWYKCQWQKTVVTLTQQEKW